MAQLWNELANQKRPEEPLNAKNNNNFAFPPHHLRNLRRAALVCPVNNIFDFAANRNAALFAERFESAWGFDKVVVEDSARSSQSKPSAAIVAVVVPAIEELLRPQNALDMLVIYITCSTAVDIAEIYDNLAAAILGGSNNNDDDGENSPNNVQAMIIVDSPCVAPLQVAPGAQLPIPLLVPRATFDGHIALKFLHAAHDCGDEGAPVTLESVAARISPIATLMGSTDGTRYPWNPSAAAPSSQAVTFLISSSIEPVDEATLRAIDGRNVGKALKQQMPGARLRYLVEKEQPIVLNFNAEDTMRPPEAVLHHEDCAAEFEAALAGAGIFSTRLGNVMPSIDRRFIASITANNNNVNNQQQSSTTTLTPLQFETMKLFKAVSSQSIRLQVNHRIPQKTFAATNMALAFKYEATASYRAYLLLEALVRLHVASPEHRLRIEDLTPPVIAGENVDASAVPPFMFIRAGVAASAAGISPRKQMFVSAPDNNNKNVSASRALPMNVTLQQQQLQQDNSALLNVSAASPLPLVAQQQLQQQQQQQTSSSSQIEAIVQQALAASKHEQEQQIRNAIRQEINQTVPQIVRDQVQESNMQMASQFQQALEQMRAEFFMELRKTAEFNTNEIRETESRWKKHLLLIENRLQRLEQQQQQQDREDGESSSLTRMKNNSSNHNNNNYYSPLTIRNEISAAVDALGTPMQQLDQKVATLSSRLDSTNDRLLSLEQLVSTTTRNLTTSQDNWMTQRDSQLQQFSTTLTQTLEQRLSHIISEGRMRVLEDRFDEFVENYQHNQANTTTTAPPVQPSASPSPSRALTERISSIESTAEQAKRDCASLDQKLAFLEDSTKRVIANSEETIKSDLSTSVNRFSSDLSQRLVSYLNDSITRINAELNHMKTHMSSQIDSSVAMKLSSQQDNLADLTSGLESSVKKSTSDVRELRTRVQQLEVGQQSGFQTLGEEDKNKGQRIAALEEQVGRLTNFIRSM